MMQVGIQRTRTSPSPMYNVSRRRGRRRVSFVDGVVLDAVAGYDAEGGADGGAGGGGGAG